MQIFAKQWKDNVNTCDTGQFITVCFWPINTWYTGIYKIKQNEGNQTIQSANIGFVNHNNWWSINA